VGVVDRRIGLLFALFLLLLAVATARATWLGTVKAGELRSRALHQQVEDLPVPARRGTVTDRRGLELAVSEDAVTVFANPFLIEQPARVAAKLAPLIHRPESTVLRLLADRSKGFVYLGRKLDASLGARVERLEIEGVGTVLEPKRRYPQGSLASQLLGSVGTDNYGLAGLEQAHEKRLHGVDGRRRVVKDALGKPVSIVEVERSSPGDDLQLTIDAAFQERVETVLAEVGRDFQPKGATALVLDPRTGAVLALANWPRVDGNDIGGAPAYARQNRGVAASYEPGSTFKAFTVAGALQEGLITWDSAFHLPPTIRVADRKIAEAHARGPVTLTVAEILAQSSNVGSVKVGLAVGRERFDHWIRRFGFGEPTGIELPGEARGIVPRPKEYSGSSLGNLSIGQGLAVTPVQMAGAYGAIANGGVLHRPHVVAGERAPARRVVSARTAKQVSRMLEGVLVPGGTASEVSVDGYRLAGKTGTAEKPDGRGGYSKYRFVASFIGYAPARRPGVLVAVMVDEPKGSISGAEVAAPAFQKIVSFALPYLQVPPD
jgi:cell division protein FtsI (penicillin-binding protein 3)